MDRNLALEFVRVTEAGAIAAAKWMGRGDKIAADKAAVDEMRARFSSVEFNGIIAIGEGKKDEAPELFVDELVGTGQGVALDIAVDPLECTNSVANGTPNAISVIATGLRGTLFRAPDMYMNKIAGGPATKDVINLLDSPENNIIRAANKLAKKLSEILVMVLDRPRPQDLITQIPQPGPRVRLITDGDVAGAIAPSLPDSGIDLLMGIGASAEAVLASAAIKCLGGEFQAQLKPKNSAQEDELRGMGIIDFNKIYTTEDLVSGNDITFTATGVIDGPMLKGVRYTTDYCITHSVVMRVKTGTVRYLETWHRRK